MTDLVTLIGTSLPRLAARLYPDIAWRIPSADRTAYLTFDDGPNERLTLELLEVLERHGAKGSFFLLGHHAERHPGLVRELVEAGHTVGNHTYSHVDGWRSAASEVEGELERATRVLEDASGRRVAWMRPPYGRFTRAMRAWCERQGQTLTMWDVGTGDFLDRVDEHHVVRHVAAYVRPGSLIVLHDNPCCADTTPAALDRMLRRLTSDGWHFPALPR